MASPEERGRRLTYKNRKIDTENQTLEKLND